MQRIITLTVQNSSGVLNRVTGMLSKRGFNIESITVGSTDQEGISKMTIVVEMTDDKSAEQLTKQLHKQIDVLKVNDITDSKIVARELALIKVGASNTNRGEIQSIIEPFRARVLDVARNSLIIEVTGKTDKVNALIELLEPYGIKDLSRTGVTAFRRGQQKNVQDIKTLSV
ncbi:acetolactate synthase small subunit [Jeotgalicoccus meleagridis]|jgi:acetolactate synthase-1/3 small subunit|uniref:Acetolactate synthase small subunit n=1 Tax=Jeotgalicoccus meleagridis TaxID=2759181 RepID=A0A6V7RP15_9STAP|nr:acetolactate synthase small subunit [Jeotgalicoccus meleagridis]CAD2079505.1 Acetolactate synthase small subunit [Jeotgalicoccus meleagridis]HIW38952.1 acetolactate synthase small subunit [Candidatus Jeotgalicoccus stercoravium]